MATSFVSTAYVPTSMIFNIKHKHSSNASFTEDTLLPTFSQYLSKPNIKQHPSSPSNRHKTAHPNLPT